MKSLMPEEVFEYQSNMINYIACHSEGTWLGFSHKPTMTNLGWKGDLGTLQCVLFFNIDFAGDWKDSLFERPAPPDPKDLEIAELKKELATLRDENSNLRQTLNDIYLAKKVWDKDSWPNNIKPFYTL